MRLITGRWDEQVATSATCCAGMYVSLVYISIPKYVQDHLTGLLGIYNKTWTAIVLST